MGFVPAGTAQQASTATDSVGNSLLSSGNVLGNDLKITAADGTELWIDLANAKTVQDVIDRINNNPANNGSPTKQILARLAQTGNGIELVDQTGGAGTLSVTCDRREVQRPSTWDSSPTDKRNRIRCRYTSTGQGTRCSPARIGTRSKQTAYSTRSCD